MQNLEGGSREALSLARRDLGRGDNRDAAQAERPPKNHRVLVAYASRFGNTRRLAEALANGLRTAPGLAVDCRSLDAVTPTALGDYGFLAVGGPTEVLSASKPMKEFLDGLAPRELWGTRGFAFDTKLRGRMAGSAGRFIEKRLERAGVEIVRPPASAHVRGMTKEERTKYGNLGVLDWVRKLDKSAGPAPENESPALDLLAPGSEAEFQRIGSELGATLLAPRT